MRLVRLGPKPDDTPSIRQAGRPKSEPNTVMLKPRLVRMRVADNLWKKINLNDIPQPDRRSTVQAHPTISLVAQS